MGGGLREQDAFDGMPFGFNAEEEGLVAGAVMMDAVYLVDIKVVLVQEYFLLGTEELVVHYDEIG